MAKEIQAYTTTGLTLYAVVINSIGQVWNTSGTPAFETYNGANWTDYDIALTEAGAGIYTANMPSVVAGAYTYAVYERAGASPATTDTLKGTGWLAWSGTAEVSASNVMVDTTEILTRLPDATAGAANGLAIVGSAMDMGSISGDSTAANNLEAMLDGTGGVTLKLKNIVISNADALPNGLAVEILSTYNSGMQITGGTDGIVIGTASGSDIRLVAPSYGGSADYGIEFSGEFSGAGIGGDTETTAIKGNITGNLSGSAGSVAGAVGSVAGNVVGSVGSVLTDTTILPDSVAADGTRPTPNQALLMISRFLFERGVVGATMTVNKEDGTTASMTFTLDSATAPTAITRAT